MRTQLIVWVSNADGDEFERQMMALDGHPKRIHRSRFLDYINGSIFMVDAIPYMTSIGLLEGEG